MVNTLKFDDILYCEEFEVGEKYPCKITYMDWHVEYGVLTYVEPIISPQYLNPGSDERLIIPKFAAAFLGTGLVRSVERLNDCRGKLRIQRNRND